MEREQAEIICLACPLACRITLTVERGKVVEVSGSREEACKRGMEYAIAEWELPQRVFTATVLTRDSSQPMLPVRTLLPVPRKLLHQCMRELAALRISPPVRLGEVVLPDIAGTGVDLLASADLLS